MKLYNPPSELGGRKLFELEDGVRFSVDTIQNIEKELGLELLKMYPFLKNVDDPVYSPDWYDLSKPKPWYKRLWLSLITRNQ